VRARTLALLGGGVALGGGVLARLRRRRGPVAGAPAPVDPVVAEPAPATAAAEMARPAYAPPVLALAGGRSRTQLRGISEIRRFFRTNETPIWFVSATPFNLLGIDRWVRNFRYLNYYDSFDGTHPNVFVPKQVAPPTFDSIEEICNYLLAHKEVVDHVKAHGGGKAVFLMFDEETERLAAAAGLEVAFPPAVLRNRLAYGDMPLFLFHLLEFLDVDYEIDVDELNAGWAQPAAIDGWSQFILKDTADVVELITEAPRSGIWKLDPAAYGGISYVRGETDWHTVGSEDEAFYLRIAQAGGYRYPGADIGILVTRGRLQTDGHALTDRARTWINGIKRQFLTTPLDGAPEPPVRGPERFSFKML
jgi:hypothetical protein